MYLAKCLSVSVLASPENVLANDFKLLEWKLLQD